MLRLHPQRTQSQERAIFLDEEWRFGMAPQEIEILPPLVEHLAKSTHGKRAIGAGVDGNEPVGLGRHGVVRDIYVDKPRALVARFEDEVRRLHLGDGWIRTPVHEGLGVLEIGLLVARLPRRAAQHRHRTLHRGHVAIRRYLRRADNLAQARHGRSRCGSATADGAVPAADEERHCIGCIVLGVSFPLVGNFLDSLVPADSLELARPALSDTPHGILDALRTVDARDLRHPFGANSIVSRIGKITSRRAHYLAIAHVNVQEASAQALPSTRARKDLVGNIVCSRLRFFQVLGLGAAAYQRACRRQRRRTLDEAPAGEPMRCLFSHVCSSLFHSSATRPSDARPSQMAGRGSRSAKGGVKSLVPPGLS